MEAWPCPWPYVHVFTSQSDQESIFQNLCWPILKGSWDITRSQSILSNLCVHSLCFFARSETSLGKALGTAPGAPGPSLLDFITVCSTMALQDPCSCLICSTARSEERKCTWWAVEAPSSHRENCDLKNTNIEYNIQSHTSSYN